MNTKYLEILNNRVKDSWYNWTEAEKKARQGKAEYDAAMKELHAYNAGVEEHLAMLESKGGTI